MTGSRQPSGERFSDQEFAFLRHVRFGELPDPIRPDERVELTETDARRDRPERLNDPNEWTLRHGA